MKSYYELHVTMREASVEAAKEAVESIGYVYSRIDGDIVIGAGTKCYATKHFSLSCTEEVMIEEVEWAAKRLTEKGCHVVRKKVEKVLYDSIAGRDFAREL